MREIKFRGKNMDSDWIYGGYSKGAGKHRGKYDAKTYIMIGTAFAAVKPETVGQFTGFKDIDGKEIYEGDIIQNTKHNELIYKVKRIDGCWCAVIDHDCNSLNLCWLLENATIKIIGNIYDTLK